MTQDGVVEELHRLGIGLTKAVLSKYERGGSLPPASLLLRLGQVLRVPSDFFLREPSTRVRWRAFRELSRLGKKRQERIKVLAEQVVERQVWLHRQLTLHALAEGIICPENAQEICPGCTKDEEIHRPTGYVSAIEVMKLPPKEREKLLAKAAGLARKEYETDTDLTDFEAFGEEDIYDEP